MSLQSDARGTDPNTHPVFLGGDEVQPTCFNASSEQRAWLRKHNRTADGMETYFFEEVARRVLPKLPGNKTFG